MLHVLNAKILADERERDIRRQLRELGMRREAEAAMAEASARLAAARSRQAGPDRLCPDCPCRVAAPAR
jgi:hypothetical protein